MDSRGIARTDLFPPVWTFVLLRGVGDTNLDERIREVLPVRICYFNLGCLLSLSFSFFCFSCLLLGEGPQDPTEQKALPDIHRTPSIPRRPVFQEPLSPAASPYVSGTEKQRQYG